MKHSFQKQNPEAMSVIWSDPCRIYITVFCSIEAVPRQGCRLPTGKESGSRVEPCFCSTSNADHTAIFENNNVDVRKQWSVEEIRCLVVL